MCTYCASTLDGFSGGGQRSVPFAVPHVRRAPRWRFAVEAHTMSTVLSNRLLASRGQEAFKPSNVVCAVALKH